jgi:hypothetical protein
MTWNEALETRWQELESEVGARQAVVDEWDLLKKEQELLRSIRDLHTRGVPAP